ncbi:ATPase [Propioniciclava coleopterorum]|uniref:ATPase n=1 Tax=Propioniciclava coleopterorum TaxID=2714937 RepID=A0A6G7Y964_9ACTN|nr:SRPBCC domain-containing protein [Propioniciclava coleopterorum]QIK73157.1 ATPase [Propioniciclava coleopterorum]
MDDAARADFETGKITRTVRVAASQRATWAALTDPAAIEQWWGHPAVFPDGVREGAEGTFEWVGHGLMPMRVERFDEPHHFDLLWGGLGADTPGEDASLVQFTLEPEGPDHTLVTVVESGFDRLETAARRAAMEQNVEGWTEVLDSFVAHVEGR